MMHRRDVLAGLGAAGVASMATGAFGAQAPDHRAIVVRVSEALAPGEIHVLPDDFHLYWTLPEGRAIRYWVGFAQPGLYEPGQYWIRAKKEWPSWTPTEEMIERNPEYEEWIDGMPGGPGNPLGARALYLFDARGADTFLRIHGTNNPRTIGRRVSNGCARLTNGYAIDLYNRVPMGTRVVLHPRGVRARLS
ncbi:MAG: L,D-transpeptidase [Pseudomonadota bacterium]